MNRFLLFSACLFIAPWAALAQAPPPPPPSPGASINTAETASWFAGIGGKQKGPFTATQIKSQIATGTINSKTLLWKQGMSDWQAAGTNALFSPSFAGATPMKPPTIVTPGAVNIPPPPPAMKIPGTVAPSPTNLQNLGPNQKAPFIHTATVGTIAGHTTYFNCTKFNGNPRALLHITPVWNPVGKEPTYHDHAVGVRYDPSIQKWGIFNQDNQAMQPGASFVVVEANVVHTAAPNNIIEKHVTYVDFPKVNGISSAPFQVTYNQTPGGKPGPNNDHPIGIWYDVNRDRWAIFNQDMSPLTAGASFNIRFPNSWTYWSNSEDIIENSAYLIGIPPAKGSPNIGVTLTQYWNPGASPQGVYNPHHVGAWYDPGPNVWAIFNQDLKPMPQGVAFVVEFHPLAP